MKYTTRIIAFLIAAPLFGLTQEIEQKDSLEYVIEEIVVSGQYNARSIDKSVFEVDVINAEEIDQRAGSNLADVLNQQLNLVIVPNSSSGKSTVQMFGLDGQYFKVLVDNVPMVGDEGLGNNIDLTQISTDDILQIEIVEGAMGVQYGADAVSGVINIITKKGSKNDWNIKATIQEETVSDEYAYFDEGRHIQRILAEKNITDDLFVSASINRNDFAGFFNNQLGEDYTKNDGLRGYEWLPKEQLTGKANLYYGKNDFDAFYKFEYFTEDINRYNVNVQENYNPSTQTFNPVAQDDQFTTNRMVHQLNGGFDFKNDMVLDAFLSYQTQEREIEDYTYRILSGEKTNVVAQEFESRDALYGKATVSNIRLAENINSQIGFEGHQVKGYQSIPARGGNVGENLDKTLDTYDFFTSFEYVPNQRLSVRPGARILTSSIFKTKVAASLSALYKFKKGYELRSIVGSAPRNPNYNELYYYFVDINHNVQGNPNLNAENGFSVFTHLKKEHQLKQKDMQFNQKLSAFFLTVDNRIELTIINPQPLAYQYNNIDKYTNLGASLINNFKYKRFNANLGLTYSGVSKVLDSQTLVNDDYLFGFQGNTTVSYKFPQTETVLTGLVKMNGPELNFVQQVDQNGELILVKGKQEGFTMGDFTIQQPFLQNKINATLGIRNLFDVDRVNTTAIEGGAHSGPPSSRLLGYGRSYFLKTTFNLSK